MTLARILKAFKGEVARQVSNDLMGIKTKEDRMALVRFVVDGPLVGYKARSGHWGDSGKRYRGFKRKVWALAMQAGWRHRNLTARRPACISVTIHWKLERKVDWKNVVGAIEDALYPDDHFVDPGIFEVKTHCGVEQALVVVES